MLACAVRATPRACSIEMRDTSRAVEPWRVACVCMRTYDVQTRILISMRAKRRNCHAHTKSQRLGVDFLGIHSGLGVVFASRVIVLGRLGW